MTFAAFFKGLFAIAEAVPVIRDGFYAALSEFYQRKMDAAKQQRNAGLKELKSAETPEQIQKALSIIIRGKSL